MNRPLFSFFILILFCSCSTTKEGTKSYSSDFINTDAYYNYRYELLKKSEKARFDSDVALLDSIENVANGIFLSLVESEKDRLKDVFPPSLFFCNVKKKMEISPFFDLIDKMPKASMTRGHIQSIGNYSWLIDQAFKSDDCYIYLGGDNDSWVNHSLHFFSKPPNQKWRSVKELNKIYEGGFKNDVYELITLGKEDYPYENIKVEYDKIIKRTQGLISYRPIFRDYLKKICEELIEKQILYMELHSSFNGMYDMKRSYFNAEQEMDLYVSIRNEIKKTYPDFDFKVIYSISQSDKEKSLKEHYQTALDLFDSYPDVFGGFDFAQGKAYNKREIKSLVDQYFKTKSDPYYSEMFLPLFFNPEEKEYFFHEGIYDAILLNSKRVGYAYELYKHPELMRLIKEKDIAVELSPISNQVFGSAPDLRHHPAKVYINYGIPFILGCENQGILKYSYTHQFYNAILAWNLDLAALKKTITNSIDYSVASDENKEKILLIWSNQWKVFIQDILHNSKRYQY